MSEPIQTQWQVELAKTGEAVGQCSECGNYRADGKPPILHQPDCSHKDDWRDDPNLGMG